MRGPSDSLDDVPWLAHARVLARSTIIARTAGSGSGAPTPAACERMMFRCSCAASAAGIDTVQSLPTRVETPQTGRWLQII